MHINKIQLHIAWILKSIASFPLYCLNTYSVYSHMYIQYNHCCTLRKPILCFLLCGNAICSGGLFQFSDYNFQQDALCDNIYMLTT